MEYLITLLSLVSSQPQSTQYTDSIYNMPQIPFEVYYKEYDKTINVIATCKADDNTIVLYFDPSTAKIYPVVQATVTKAFDMPGITRVGVCRVKQ